MKISQDMRANVDTKQLRPVVGGKQSFSRLVEAQVTELKKEGLDQLIQDIEKQGEKLARFRTFRELAKFKLMVKNFLQDTVYKGLDLQKSSSFNFEGEHRTLALVKQVDDNLMELTESLMDHEKKSVDLLGVIGEIKGLLINIYT